MRKPGGAPVVGALDLSNPCAGHRPWVWLPRIDCISSWTSSFPLLISQTLLRRKSLPRAAWCHGPRATPDPGPSRLGIDPDDAEPHSPTQHFNTAFISFLVLVVELHLPFPFLPVKRAKAESTASRGRLTLASPVRPQPGTYQTREP